MDSPQQALRDQNVQRLAQGAPGDAQVLGQGELRRELVVRLPLAGGDLAAQGARQLDVDGSWFGAV